MLDDDNVKILELNYPGNYRTLPFLKNPKQYYPTTAYTKPLSVKSLHCAEDYYTRCETVIKAMLLMWWQ